MINVQQKILIANYTLQQIKLIKKTNNKKLNGLKVNMIFNESKSIASKFSELFGSTVQEIDKKIPKSKKLTPTISKTEN